MLIVNSICGNVYQNNRLADKLELAKSNGTLRLLLLSRIEMEKARLRKETEDGFEVGLEFESGTKIHHGDIVSENLEFIMVEQESEKVITIKFKGYGSSDLFLFIGHTIGNRHKPISVQVDGSISFPINDDSELDLFKKLFHEVIHKMELVIEEKIFTPNENMNAHGH